MYQPKEKIVPLHRFLQHNQFNVCRSDGTQNQEYEVILDFLLLVHELLELTAGDTSRPRYIRGSSLTKALCERVKEPDNPYLFTQPFCRSPLDLTHSALARMSDQQYLFERVTIASTFFKPNVDIYYPVCTADGAETAAQIVMSYIEQVNAGIIREVHAHSATITYFKESFPNGIVRINVALNGGYSQHESINLIFKPSTLTGVDAREMISERQSALIARLVRTHELDFKLVIPTENEDRVNRPDKLTFLASIATIGAFQALEFLSRTVRFNARNPIGRDTLTDAQLTEIARAFEHLAIDWDQASLFTIVRAASEMFWAFMFQPQLVIRVLSQLPDRFFPHVSRSRTLAMLEKIKEQWRPIRSDGDTLYIDDILCALYGVNSVGELENTPVGRWMGATFDQLISVSDQGFSNKVVWNSNIRFKSEVLFGYLLFAFLPLHIDDILKIVPADLKKAKSMPEPSTDHKSGARMIRSRSRYELTTLYARKPRFTR